MPRCQPELLPGVELRRVDADDHLWTGHSVHYGFTLVLSGAFDFWYRRGVHTHDAARVKLKEPGELHRDLRVHAPVTAQTVTVEPAIVAEAAAALGLGAEPHWGCVLTPGVDEAVLRLHGALAAPALDRLVAETALADALALALGRYGERRPGRVAGARPEVVRALELLRARMDETLTLDELAAAAGMNKFHLLRCFRRELGAPPHEYRTLLRVARAQSLLAAGVPAVEVAVAVGFCDQSQLHRHFTRIVRVTPGQYARDARRSRTPKIRRAARAISRE